ncbi:CACTA en-spm transposon protein [Cucumis melo var. makuwa]|uniref:CACTA en-spm transposon protein n=1 Tax=Cucumis melo var. makuwa TaxID=1194695 RepID=A0A5D3CWY5_CUCMM|nr:CACTA en-spm transposon protein [Cucumis melo var. makuwa]
MEEGRLEDEMPRNIGVDIDEYATNIFQALLNEARTMSLFPRGFDKTNVIFLEFVEDLGNLTEGSSSMGDNSSTSQPSASSTLRRRAQSRILELEHYVAVNGRILMTIAPLRREAYFPTRHSL